MEISLYDHCAQSNFLRKPVGACSHLSYISLASICSQEYVRSRRKYQGTQESWRPYQNQEQLGRAVRGCDHCQKSQTPPGSEEDVKTRDNRLQEIRRLQALRWYQYKYIIPRWEVLFALKNPWSDVTALKSGWARDKRGPPPPDADPFTLKTAADFQHIVEARRKAIEKCQAAKARKLAAAGAEGVEAQGAGPSAALKGKNKTSRRAKEAEVVSPLLHPLETMLRQMMSEMIHLQRSFHR